MNVIKSTLLFILVLTSSFSFSQDTDYKTSKRTKKFINEVSGYIKAFSLYSDSLNWKQIEDELASLSLGRNDSINQIAIFDFFSKKLKSVGDKHSFFITKSGIKSYVKQHSEPEQPESKYLGNGIGLIKVPRCMTFDYKKDKIFANSIRSQINKLDTENQINGWIVDLRHNGGGNMWPMIAGLNALIEDGIVGYTIGTTKTKDKEWKSENGKIGISRESVDTYKVKNLNAKIAVLIDSMTGSSGEMTAISFIGLPNVKVFGQASAGYTTANSTINLSDGSQLYLATNFVADRTHKAYPDRIIPDVIVSNQSIDATDKVIESTKGWILELGIK